MAINKVIYGTSTLIDLTTDTVAVDTLGKDTTAHDKSGTVITGTLENSGGVNVGETWFLHRDFDRTKEKEFRAKFTSDGKTYNSIKIGGVLTSSGDVARYQVLYDTETILTDNHVFNDTDARRRITFADSPTGDLLTWLKASATKQPNDTAELITIKVMRSHFNNGFYLYSGATFEQINTYLLPSGSVYADAPNESIILLLIDGDVYGSHTDWLQEDVANNPEKFLMQDFFTAYDHDYFLALFKAVNGLEI